MDLLKGIALLLFGFASLIPVIRLAQYKAYQAYRALRYLVHAVFVWTVILFLFYMIDDMTVAYYLSLLIYPLVFGIVFLTYETIQTFIGKQTPLTLRIFAGVFMGINLIVSLTNNLHQWVSTLQLHEAVTLETIMYADAAWFFYVHTGISYVFVLVMFIKLISYLAKPTQIERSVAPLYLVVWALVIGISISTVHVFFYTFYLDPTYLTFVIFTFVLYIIVFRKDFQFALLTSSRGKLIDAMREMYIIADNRGAVVEYSKDIDTLFSLESQHKKQIETMMEKIGEQAVLYPTFDFVKDKPLEMKLYLYTIFKDFKIPGFKHKGTLVLMYDETRLMALVDNLNHMRKHDQMTGTLNRNHLEEMIDFYQKKHPNFSLVVIDLNGLKLINDHLGHKAGDELLKRFASTLKDTTKAYDDVALYRLGGDEFLIYIPEADKALLEAMIDTVDKALYSKDMEKRISAAFGYAIRQKDEPFNKTFKRADKALYVMKEKRSQPHQKALLEYLEEDDSKKG